MADFAGTETRSRRNKDPGGDLVTLGVDYVLRPSSVSLVKRRRASLRTHTHALTRQLSAAVDRDCICVGGRDTLRSIYLRCSASFSVAPTFREPLARQEEREKRRTASRLFRPVTHLHEARSRPFATWITLRIVMRSSHLFAKLLKPRRGLLTRRVRVFNALE